MKCMNMISRCILYWNSVMGATCTQDHPTQKLHQQPSLRSCYQQSNTWYVHLVENCSLVCDKISVLEDPLILFHSHVVMCCAPISLFRPRSWCSWQHDRGIVHRDCKYLCLRLNSKVWIHLLVLHISQLV